MSTSPITINILKENFQNYVQAQNSEINAFAINSFWDIMGGTQAATLLDLYATLQLIINSINVQNSVGDQVDKQLYQNGLPARGGITYGVLGVTMPADTPATVPADTIFTDAITGNQFQTFVSIDFVDDTTVGYLYALTLGNTSLEPIGNELTGSTFTVVVTSSTNGQMEETDASCITRLLQAKRAPIAGARATDYEVYCLKANILLPVPTITAAIIIPSFISDDNVGRVGVIPLVGTSISEYQLNQGLLPSTSFIEYSREAGASELSAVTTYVQSLRLVGTNPIVVPCVTYVLDPITINVTVPAQYSADYPITLESQDIDGNPISITLTVTQLIQRELRRAICNQPFGATTLNSQNFILVENLYTLLNAQLSAQNGALAQLILQMFIVGGDISVPYYTASVDELQYVYDFSAYSDITVSVTTNN